MSRALIVIAGPTASGKTALAIDVARRLGGEIVNADSQQVYRGFDIGTAKPSPDELAAVPHHLISFVDPMDAYSAARFQKDADAAIEDIARRGKTPVVVGGTGLYLRVLLRGVMPGSSTDPALRSQLESRAAIEGREALHEELRRIDPASALKIQPTDLVRIIRALEIHAQTGQPASIVRAQHGFGDERHPHRLFVLSPEREALYPAINERTRRMYERGLIEETRALIAAGFRDAAPMRSVGYAQALDVIEGRLELARAIELTAQATRNYAKRQFTWFKKEPATFLKPPYDAAAISTQDA